MLITVLTVLLLFICFVVVMLIMIQRTSGGMGSALGGGAADQVLGAGSAAQLTKMTVWGILGFFILAFFLYGLYQSNAVLDSSTIRAGTPDMQSDPASGPESDLPVPDSSDSPQPLPGSPDENLEVPVVPNPSQDVVPAPAPPSPLPEANSSQ